MITTGLLLLRLWKGGGINKITIGTLHLPLCRERGKIIGHLSMEEVQSLVIDKIIGQTWTEEVPCRGGGVITCLLENQCREDQPQPKAGIPCKENKKKLSHGQWKELSDRTAMEF